MGYYLSALHTVCSNDIGSILVWPGELCIDGLRSAADSKFCGRKYFKSIFIGSSTRALILYPSEARLRNLHEASLAWGCHIWGLWISTGPGLVLTWNSTQSTVSKSTCRSSPGIFLIIMHITLWVYIIIQRVCIIDIINQRNLQNCVICKNYAKITQKCQQ